MNETLDADSSPRPERSIVERVGVMCLQKVKGILLEKVTPDFGTIFFVLTNGGKVERIETDPSTRFAEAAAAQIPGREGGSRCLLALTVLTSELGEKAQGSPQGEVQLPKDMAAIIVDLGGQSVIALTPGILAEVIGPNGKIDPKLLKKKIRSFSDSPVVRGYARLAMAMDDPLRSAIEDILTDKEGLDKDDIIAVLQYEIPELTPEDAEKIANKIMTPGSSIDDILAYISKLKESEKSKLKESEKYRTTDAKNGKEVDKAGGSCPLPARGEEPWCFQYKNLGELLVKGDGNKLLELVKRIMPPI